MGIIQKDSIKIILTTCFAILATLIITFSGVIVSETASARDGCPGDEFPGTGANATKCYRNQQIRNITTQVATGNTVTPPANTPPTTTDPATTPAAANNADTTVGDEDKNSVTCAVEKIGWILCPIMEGAAKISDKAFAILADNFLRTDPELVRDDSGTKIAWEVARNLANIMFIIAFLFIIFSQVSGRGINNYGIKRMLPRLIIAAIAVNISYYICQLAVDITNILGYEIQSAMAQIANTVGPSVFGKITPADTETANLGVLTNPGILATIVAGALAAGAVVWFMLPTIAALIPLILITVSTIIIVLLLRKAFIVLLIVLAPIAFVMYLLPNTEKYFSKWLNMFTQLLMVFPIVGLLFGAGQLASTIILVAGSNNNQAQAAAACNPDDEKSRTTFNEDKRTNDNSICGEKSVVVSGAKSGTNATCGAFAVNGCNVNDTVTASWTMGLVATGIAIAPLLAVWAVLKGALSAAGAIGGKISGAVERGVRGGVNAGAGGGKKAWEQSAFGRGQAIRKQIKKNYKDQEFAKRMSKTGSRSAYDRYTQIAARGVAGNVGAAMNKNGVETNPLTGGLKAQDSRLTSQFSEAADKIQQQEVQAERLEVNKLDIPEVLGQLFNSNGQLNAGVDANSARTAALIQRAMEAGSAKEKAAIIDAFRQGGNTLASRTTASSLAANNPGYYSASSIDAISRGAATTMQDANGNNIAMSAENMALAGIRDNKFGADKMASANKSDTEWAHDIAVKANDQIAMALNKKNATVALTSEQTKTRVGSQRNALMDMTRR